MVEQVYMNKMVKFDYHNKNNPELTKEDKDGDDKQVAANPARTPEV